MKPILLMIHIFVSLALIFIVLIQKGKGADMGAAFGGSSQAVFGTSTATTVLHKVTTMMAIVFMLTSLGLTLYIGRGHVSSVMEGVKPTKAPVSAEKASAPAKPAETPSKASK